ncbi:MAG: polysaccharide deacetylase family protein [Fimbriimonadaceae bacterium]
MSLGFLVAFLSHPHLNTAFYADQSIPKRYHGRSILNKPAGFNEKVVALTFDDGPEPTVTPQILKTLEKEGVKATFFVIGSYAKRHPQLVLQTAQAGHVVGSHTWTHKANRSRQQAGPEVWWTAKTIYRATGAWPAVFRPPYGLDKGWTARIARAEGYPSVLWNKSSADTARNATAGTVYWNSATNIRPGDVILFHDAIGKAHTAAAIPKVIATYKKHGYEFVTVPEMLRRWDAFATAKWAEKYAKQKKLAATKPKQSAPKI